jgi:hypothetical protein
VSWNGRDWLAHCLPAVAEQTHADFETIVVDNGSTDGTVEWLAEQWPAVRVVCLERNLGFAAANNAGIEVAAGEFVVTLNNDTRPDAAWLGQLLVAADSPDVGMIASQIVLWERPEIVDSAGIEVDRAGFAWQRGWGRQAGEMDEGVDVFGPSAAAAAYRRAMLDQIGLFDEAFFAYYEDVDLAWRGRRAGWRCRYAPGARVLHHHSATGGRQPALKAYLISRNRWWTLVKNYPWPALFWALPLILLYDAIALARGLIVERQVAGARGRLSALSGLPKMIGRRGPGGRVSLAPFPRPGQLRSRGRSKRDLQAGVSEDAEAGIIGYP